MNTLEYKATGRDWTKEIAKLPIFAGLSRRQLRKLVDESRFSWFAPGDEVVVAGDEADASFIILAGEARARGKRAARPLGRGDFFGEMALIGQPRSATVVATTELNVMSLPQRTTRALFDRHPRLGMMILEQVGQRLRRLEQAG